MACVIKRIIQFNVPVHYKPISIMWNDTDITGSCLFSWGTDMVCWTNWCNYDTYKAICSHVDSDYYLRVLIAANFNKIYYDGAITNCYSVAIYNENPFLTQFCDNVNLLNPYANLDCALLLQQQLSDSIICMFGIPVYYIRVLPNKETVDYTFKEYVLHDVVDIKQQKLMLEDGQLPSTNPQMSEFDFDWENDWEVEMSKSMFAAAFGDTAFPKQRDMIYVPLLKRMYEVNSAYDEKAEALMGRATTWKLGLIKWNEKDNVDQNVFGDIIDGWIENKYEEVFADEVFEQERKSGALQAESPVFAANNVINLIDSDAVRSLISRDEFNNIITKQINNRSLMIVRNAYRFTSPESVVIYQHKYCGQSGVISFVVSTPGYMEFDVKNIIETGNIGISIKGVDNNFILSFNGMEYILEPQKTYLCICRWNRGTFTTELNVYEHKYPENIPVYKIRPEMGYFDITDSGLTSVYNNEFITPEKSNIRVYPWPMELSNIKIYENYLSLEDAIKESLKYTTTNELCVVNDLCRPIEAPLGYTVK